MVLDGVPTVIPSICIDYKDTPAENPNVCKHPKSELWREEHNKAGFADDPML